MNDLEERVEHLEEAVKFLIKVIWLTEATSHKAAHLCDEEAYDICQT